jgi:transcriptional regulator GlxA family with amidase domain
MPSKTAKQRYTPKNRTIVFVVYPGFKLLDLAGPLQAFTDALDEAGKCVYLTVVASVDGATLGSDTPTAITTEPLSKWKRRDIDSLIVVVVRVFLTQ